MLNYYQETGDEIDNIYVCPDRDDTLVSCVRYIYIRDGYLRHVYNMRYYEPDF